MAEVARTADKQFICPHGYDLRHINCARCENPAFDASVSPVPTGKHGTMSVGAPPQGPVDIEKKALANLLDAVEGVLWYSWADSDLDTDAAQAIDRLRLARDQYGTVQGIKNGQ
jgi:hypothetical protein